MAEDLAVPTVGRYQWSGLQADVPFHGRVLTADGHALASHEDLYTYAASRPVGTRVRYTFEKNGARIERDVPTMRFGEADFWLTVGLFALNGWLYLAAGGLVFLLQPASRAAGVFFVMGVTLALFPLTATTLYRPPPGPWIAILHFTSQAFFPATFLHLACTFPVERPLLGRRRWWIGASYAVSTLLAVASLIGFYADPPDLRPLYGAWIYAAAAIVTLWGTTVYAYWEQRSALIRRQARIISLGLIAGTTVAVFGFVDNAQGGGHFPMNFIALTPIVFFVSVGYAIVRHDLFDVDRLVRQAVEYAVVTALITAAYAITVLTAGWIAGSSFAQLGPLTIAFLVAIAFAFDPLRRRVQAAIDRTFFRNRPDHRRTLRDVSETLATILDLREIVTRVGGALREAMVIERVAIALWPDDGETSAWSSDDDAGADRALDVLLRARMASDRGRVTAAALRDAPRPDERALREAMQRARVALIVPLLVSERLLGYLALGEKRSGRSYDGGDVELLATLANQTAIAVQNASSYRLLQSVNERLEDKVRARTEELQRSNQQLAAAYQRLQATQTQLIQAEKLGSLGQLVAGVAHELNNPLTFIVGNVVPVQRQLAALRDLAAARRDAALLQIADEMAQILAVISSGAERTATIVKDLRTFSRLEEGAWSIVDLREGLRVTLNLLRPRWKDRVVIHTELDQLPGVACDPGQINQVFMNILSNACDAIPATGNIWIRAWTDGERVAIAIRDDGEGMDANRVARIFDPFFTTKEIGKGTGLGLAIAHGIVQRHLGRIEVASAPGGGTEFTVYLPIRERRRSVA